MSFTKINKQLLTPAEAGKLLHVSPITIRRWAQEGRLKFFTTPGGHRRFDLGDVKSMIDSSHGLFLASNNVTLLIVGNDEYTTLMIDVFVTFYPKVNMLVAKNVFEAGELVFQYKPNMVIVDLTMCDSVDFSICHYLKKKEETKNIIIIALTDENYTAPKSSNKPLLIEASLTKPINLELFKQIFNDIVKKYALVI